MKFALVIVKILISIGLLIWLISRAVAENQFQVFVSGQRPVGWFAMAVATGLFANVTSFYRWHILARAVDLPIRLWETVRISFVSSFFGLFAFGMVGTDSVRAFMAARRSPNRRVEAVASVFVDRLCGVSVMCLIAAVGFFFQRAERWERLSESHVQSLEWLSIAALGFGLAGIGGTCFLMFVPHLRRYKWFQKLLSLPWVGRALHHVVGILVLYRRRPGALLYALLLSFVSNCVFSLTVFSCAKFVGGAHPTLFDHLVIAPISLVANSIPLPGGLGGMETALDFLYRAFADVDSKEQIGVVVAFAFRFILLLVSTLGAVLWFSMPRVERESIQHSGEANSGAD